MLAFVLQDSLLKLNYHQEYYDILGGSLVLVISHVGLVCLRDEVEACNCKVARCDFIAR